MFEIVGRLRCPVCSEIVKIDDKVFLDIINTVIHQECYHRSFSDYNRTMHVDTESIELDVHDFYTIHFWLRACLINNHLFYNHL